MEPGLQRGKLKSHFPSVISPTIRIIVTEESPEAIGLQGAKII
jgi:hypothetical protein